VEVEVDLVVSRLETTSDVLFDVMWLHSGFLLSSFFVTIPSLLVFITIDGVDDDSASADASR
jgi:hypothetical protein